MLSYGHDKKTSLRESLNASHRVPVGLQNQPSKVGAAQSKSCFQNPKRNLVLCVPLCAALQRKDTNSVLLVCWLTHSFFNSCILYTPTDLLSTSSLPQSILSFI